MKFHKPIKRYPGLIDLTSIGAQEQHEQSIYRMRMDEIRFRNEDEAQANLPEQPAPSEYYPEIRPKFSIWRAIINGALMMRP